MAKEKEEKKQTAEEKWRAVKRNKILLSIVQIIFGAILLIYPQQSMETVCKIIGAGLLVSGLGMLAASAVKKSAVAPVFMVLGIVIGVLGAWIFLSPDTLIGIIPTIMGVLIAADGIANLSEAVAIGKQGSGGTVLAILLAIVTIAFGAILIFKPMGIARFIIRIMAISVIYNGISDFLIAFRIKPVLLNIEVSDAEPMDPADDAQPVDASPLNDQK